MADEEKVLAKEEIKKPTSLPKEKFFTGGRMMKWAEEAGLFPSEEKGKKEIKEEKKSVPTVKEEAKKKEEPCEGCPEEKKEEKPKTPFKVIKHDGKDIPISSEEDLIKLAEKGYGSTEWEKDLEAREKGLDRISLPLSKLVNFVEKGGVMPGISEEDRDLEKKDELESEEFEDVHPAVKELLKKQKEEIQVLKRESSEAKNIRQHQVLNSLVAELDKNLNEARVKFPFEEHVDKESGENVTQQFFAGMISVLVNNDKLKMAADPSFKLKPLQKYVELAAEKIHKFQRAMKIPSNDKEITSEFISEKYPDAANEIGQQAIAKYLKQQGESPPSLKASLDVASGLKKDKKRPKSLNDAFKQAMEDKVLVATESKS